MTGLEWLDLGELALVYVARVLLNVTMELSR